MNINQLIEENRLHILFQPIISTYNQRVIGYEALARGIDSNGSFISPILLFESASASCCVLALDQLCISKAIQAFKPILLAQPDALLFVNINNTVINAYLESTFIMDCVSQNQIHPRNIILEINELASTSLDSMKAFSKFYKACGFAIALDDVGAGHSNLDRVALIKPDIIKIDKDLIMNISTSFYRQQIVRMIIQLSTSLGAMTVSEGVETLEDALFVLEHGGNFLQGFYISKPVDLTPSVSQDIHKNIHGLCTAQQAYIEEKLEHQLELNDYLRMMSNLMIDYISTLQEDQLEGFLNKLITYYPDIECVYVINEKGLLLTDTLFNLNVENMNQRSLYTPCKKGDSVTLQKYYYQLVQAKWIRWVSDPYISLATGNKCITISSYFLTPNKERTILCIDFNSQLVSERQHLKLGDVAHATFTAFNVKTTPTNFQKPMLSNVI